MLYREKQKILSREAIFDVIFVKIFQPQEVKSSAEILGFLKESCANLGRLNRLNNRSSQLDTMLIMGEIEFSFYTFARPAPISALSSARKPLCTEDIRKKLWDPSIRYVGNRLEYNREYEPRWHSLDFDLDINALRMAMVERIGRMALKQFADEPSRESVCLRTLLNRGVIGFSKECKFYVKEAELFQSIDYFFAECGIRYSDEKTKIFLDIVEPLAESSPRDLIQYLNSIIDLFQRRAETIFGYSLRGVVDFFDRWNNGGSRLIFMDARTSVENNRILEPLKNNDSFGNPLILPQADQTENCKIPGLTNIPVSSFSSAISLIQYVNPHELRREEILESLLEGKATSDESQITPEHVRMILNFNYYIVCNEDLFNITKEKKFYISLFKIFASSDRDTSAMFKTIVENCYAFGVFFKKNRNRPEATENFKFFVQKFVEVISTPNNFYKFSQDYGFCIGMEDLEIEEDFERFFESDPTPDKEISRILVSDEISDLVSSYSEAINNNWGEIPVLEDEDVEEIDRWIWKKLIVIFKKAISEYRESQVNGQPRSATLDFLQHLQQINFKIIKCLQHCWIKSLWVENLHSIYIGSPEKTKIAFSEKMISLLYQITYPDQGTEDIKEREMVFMELLENNPEIFWLFHDNANAWRRSIYEFSCAAKFDRGVLSGRKNLFSDGSDYIYPDDSYHFDFLTFLDRSPEVIKEVFKKRKQISADLDEEYRINGYTSFDEVLRRLGIYNENRNSSTTDEIDEIICSTMTTFESGISQEEEMLHRRN